MIKGVEVEEHPPQMSIYLEPHNGVLFGNMIFVDI